MSVRQKLSLPVRASSAVLQLMAQRMRWVWYQLRAFVWHRALPWDTVIYGNIDFARLPCRIMVGKHCSFGRRLYLETARDASITLGDNVTINTGCHIVASEKIVIGKNTAIAEFVSLRDQQHNFEPGHGVRGQGFKVAPIEIGENCWLGRGVFIGPGTIIGDNCVVAANSVVHGEFPSGVLIAGAPAKVKKHYTSKTSATTEAG